MDFKCVDYGHPDATPINILALDDVLELHKKRFIAKTRSNKILILKYLRWCDFVRCSNVINNDKVANSLREELACIQAMPKERISDEMMIRASEIGVALKPYVDPMMWACIEAPAISSADAMNALYMSLDVDERLKLDEILAGLTAQIPNSKLDGALRYISETYNVPLVSASELLQMTYQQVVLLCPTEDKK